VMFGSHAMDQARRDSDIDVVVVSADFCGRGLLERIDMMVPAICEVRAPIEAVAVTPEEWETRERLIVTFADNGVEV